MSVQYVRHIGVRRECFDSLARVIVSRDQSIALECEVAYMHPIIWQDTEAERWKRYLIASRDVLRKAVDTALSHETVTDAGSAPSRTNLVTLTTIMCNSTNTDSWVVIPPFFGWRDASTNDLPGQFREYAEIYAPDATVPFEDQGRRYEVRIRLRHNMVQGRTTRRWWGYPAQVLLIPAAAIDVVTFPFQVFVVMREANSHFH